MTSMMSCYGHVTAPYKLSYYYYYYYLQNIYASASYRKAVA